MWTWGGEVHRRAVLMPWRHPRWLLSLRLNDRPVSQVLSQIECWVEAISCLLVRTHLFWLLCLVMKPDLDSVLAEGCGPSDEWDGFCSWHLRVTVWVVSRALVSPSVLVERIETFLEITEWNVLYKHQAVLLQ